MEFTIREYLNTDKNKCIEAFKSNVPIYFSHQEIDDFTKFLERIENDIDDIPYYVIAYNQEIIGCGGFAKAKSDEFFSLVWGLVHKDFHNKGFGEKLLSYRLKKIKQLDSKSKVIIDTTQHSEGFFKKYGFITKKKTDDYYAPGMHRIDMELKIENKD
ncbi:MULTISPECIES: GNAT family N-acetyltransferase [Flavobacterium]|uniref:GNAT family N-acetyltransferase n=1 Tax=Flavobacterium TaxID=237 RepID=UPI001183681E|nr:MULTISPECIES: GNAT family N-acetyltransferase [Flavobacterium]MCR4029566.1 GNAT family N-acetyltransferase [Flavobacterium panacis]